VIAFVGAREDIRHLQLFVTLKLFQGPSPILALRPK
jgi:hypothetical protein